MPTYAGDDSNYPANIDTWDLTTAANGEDMSDSLEQLADRTAYLAARLPVLAFCKFSRLTGTITIDANRSWYGPFAAPTITWDSGDKLFEVALGAALTAYLQGLTGDPAPVVLAGVEAGAFSFAQVRLRAAVINPASTGYGSGSDEAGFQLKIIDYAGLATFSHMMAGAVDANRDGVIAICPGAGEVQSISALARDGTADAGENLAIMVGKSSSPYSSSTDLLTGNMVLDDSNAYVEGTLAQSERAIAEDDALFFGAVRTDGGTGDPLGDVLVQVVVRQFEFIESGDFVFAVLAPRA
jgi:hypothetical protein